MNKKLRIWDEDNEVYNYLDFDNLDESIEYLDSFRDYFSSSYLLGEDFLEWSIGQQDRNNREIYVNDIVEFKANYTPMYKKAGWLTGVVQIDGFRVVINVDDELYDATEETDGEWEVKGNIR